MLLTTSQEVFTLLSGIFTKEKQGGSSMEYITSRCPHCNAVVNKSNSLTKYSEGSPLRVCPRCGGQYIDPECHEPALVPYKPYGVVACVTTSLVSGVFCGFAVLLILYMIGYFGELYEVSSVHVVASVVVGGIIAVLSFVSRTKGLAKENQEKLRLWNESRERLMNRDYARLLKKSGFEVPAEYLTD